MAFDAGIAELGVSRREQAEAEERARKARMARQRQAERRAAEEAQRDHLLKTAARWRQAQDLRAYIAAVSASPAAGRPPFAAWRAWALEEAEALDPLAGSGPELRLLPPFDG